MLVFTAAFFTNSIYHCDRALFLLLAPLFAATFFCQSDPEYALLCTYALFPLSSVIKPVGVFVFGSLADALGGKKTLCLTLLGASLTSFSIACLPTYTQCGWYAYLWLSLAQLIKQFFTATQSTNTALFMLEQTPLEKRCQASSWFDASSIAGTFLATAATYALHSCYLSWRFLFLASGLAHIIGLCLYWSLKKIVWTTPTQKTFCFQILWQHRSTIAQIAAVSGLSYTNYYIALMFMSSFLPLINTSISTSQALAMQTALLLFDACMLPVMGYLATKIGKLLLMQLGVMAVIICSLPLFMLLTQHSLLIACCARTVLVFFGICVAAPYHAWALEISPDQHRYSINAIAITIGSRCIGAPMPALCLWLYYKTGLLYAPAVPLIGTGIVALVALSSSRSCYSHNVRDALKVVHG